MFGVKKSSFSLSLSKGSAVVKDINAIKQHVAWIEFLPDGEILSANQQFLEMTGYSLSEIQGKHHRIFCDTEYVRSSEYHHFWQTLASGESVTGIFERFSKQHQRFYLSATYFPVCDDKGEVYKVIKIASDITARHQELEQKEAVITALDRSMAVIEFTTDGKVITANSNFLTHMGYALSDIVGQHHRIFCYDCFYRENPSSGKKSAKASILSDALSVKPPAANVSGLRQATTRSMTPMAKSARLSSWLQILQPALKRRSAWRI